MLKAVLFDLDNTLILFDENRFYQAYISKITMAFSDLIDNDLFQKRLFNASQMLIHNDGKQSNADFFMQQFLNGFEMKRDLIWNRFLDFYKTEYDQFADLVTIPKGIRELFLDLKRLKLKLVIASNPMWPLNIQLKRLSWANVADIHYELITHIENMSFCKPRLDYYMQICKKIKVPPTSCLMVGNDPINDMMVSKLGMHTFLTVDSRRIDGSELALSKALRKGKKLNVPEPDFTGPVSHMIEAVHHLLIRDNIQS